MKFEYPAGATPFSLDDASALIPKHIHTQNDLNEWEQANILRAEKWVFSKQRKNITSIKFLITLHKKMFDLTWSWAGHFRVHQTNIGVAPFQIAMSLQAACDDIDFWIQHKTFLPEEIAIRFHHKLVSVHPFPNGNGRLSRLAADILLYNLIKKRLTWGRQSLHQDSDLRKTYIQSLRQADNGLYEPLINFCLS
ncbi:MAG: mobile mystery protein B [Candidatus Paracaedibacteraceae bacterium]|nr:mobile mystery protein B [Candidatus Paracaedibacteraceae bacterium]